MKLRYVLWWLLVIALAVFVAAVLALAEKG
jgi:hypothetical protein